jgi:hypothetical protein
MTTTRGSIAAAASLALALAGCAEAGADGRDGTDGAVPIGRLFCAGQASSYYFEYEAVEFSTGDLWISCSIDDGYAESAESTWHFAGTTGSANGSCRLTMDVSGELDGGWWELLLDNNGTAVEATYEDAGEPDDGLIVNIGPELCAYTEPT